VTVFGTDPALTLTSTSVPPATTFRVVPGLTVTVDVPSDSIVYLATDGGLVTGSTASVVDVAFAVDSDPNNPAAAGPAGQRITSAITVVRSNAYWSMSQTRAVAAGTHTFSVIARSAFSGPVGLPVTIGGATAVDPFTGLVGPSVLQPALTVMVLSLAAAPR
jgi:hypothetical protein